MSFKPIFRMIVCSDIHFGESKLHPEKMEYENQERDFFETSMAAAYAYAQKSEYTKIDLFAAVGDFVTTGTTEQMQEFKNSLEKSLSPETEIILTMASHEYFHDGVENAEQRLMQIFGQPPCVHKTIKGFHFVSLSTDDRCNTLLPKQQWLETELEKAACDDRKKPIFLFYHPQFSDTVYGSSVLWRTPNIMRITMNYPQVISFSGHSHAALNDPRTVHQKYFTAFGTGAIIGVNTCNADRQRVQDIGNSQFLIVEADKNGSVQVSAISGTDGREFKSWTVQTPHDPDSFTYTDDRYLTAKAPVFDKSALVVANYENSRLTVSVDQATDGGERVPGYQFIVKDSDGMILRQFGISSGYEKCDLPEKAMHTIDFDMPKGKYTVECYAQSYWDKNSKKLRTQFEIK